LNEIGTSISFRSFPRQAKFYVAPVPVKQALQEFKNSRIQFLSSTASFLVAGATRSDLHIEKVQHIGLEYQVVEAILLKYGTQVFDTATPATSASEGQTSEVPIGWNNSNWEVHEDVGYQETLSQSSKLAISYPKLCPPSRPPVIEFSSMYLDIKAMDLVAETVYRSTVVNMPVGEFFTVHDADGVRYIFFHQTTTKEVQFPTDVKARASSLGLARRGQKGGAAAQLIGLGLAGLPAQIALRIKAKQGRRAQGPRLDQT
jgi:hypothetical protein